MPARKTCTKIPRHSEILQLAKRRYIVYWYRQPRELFHGTQVSLSSQDTVPLLFFRFAAERSSEDVKDRLMASNGAREAGGVITGTKGLHR